MIEIHLRCPECPDLAGVDFLSFDEAKAAYDEHMANMHPPDPRDVFVPEDPL